MKPSLFVCQFFLLMTVFIPIIGIATPAASHLRRSDQSSITYYLISNNQVSKSTELLVILQGGDCHSVVHEQAIYESYRQVLPFADTVWVEKYGIDGNLPDVVGNLRQDCPAAYLEKDNYQQRVEDLKQVINHLRQQNGYRKIVLLGFQDGAVVTTLLTEQLAQVNAIILINGGGQYLQDDILYKLRFLSSDDQAFLVNQRVFNAFADAVLKGEITKTNTDNHGYTWWKQALQMDRQAKLAKINHPVLVIQSGKDPFSSLSKTAMMIDNLQRLGKTNIEYIAYPDIDHHFNDMSGKNRTGEVIDDIMLWLMPKMNEQQPSGNVLYRMRL